MTCNKSPTRTDKSKALVVSSPSLELFQGAGLTPAFIAAGNKVHLSQIMNGDKQLASIDLSELDTPTPTR